MTATLDHQAVTVDDLARKVCAWVGGRVAYRRILLASPGGRKKKAPREILELTIVHRQGWRFAARRLKHKLGAMVPSKDGPMWVSGGATVQLLPNRTILLCRAVA